MHMRLAVKGLLKDFLKKEDPWKKLTRCIKFTIKTDKCTWTRNNTQKQAWKLLCGPSVTAKTRLLSFYRTQSRVVTGLLAELNTLRRHFYVMGLLHSPLCKRYGAQEKPQPMFLPVRSLRFTLAHPISFLFSWTWRMLEV